MISSMFRRIVGSSQPSEEPPSTRDTVMNSYDHEGDNEAGKMTIEKEDIKKKKKKIKKKDRKSGEDLGSDLADKPSEQTAAEIRNGELRGDEDTIVQMDADGVDGTAEELKVKKKKTKKSKKRESDNAQPGHGTGPDLELEDGVSASPPNALESPNGAVKVKKHKKSLKSLQENEATREQENPAETTVATSAKAKKRKRKQDPPAPGSSLEATNGLQGDGQTEGDREAQANATPSRPSESALGKRKASEALPDSTRKTKRKHRAEEPSGTDQDIGFTSSHPDSTQQTTARKPLQSPTQDQHTQNAKGEGVPSSILPSQTGRTHRPTPTFTAINVQRSPSNQEIQGPRVPTPEPEHSNPEDPPSPPKSNQKRKRRLPVDQPESSQQNIQSTPSKPTKGNPKTPKSRAPSKHPPLGRTLTPEDVEAVSEAVEMYRDSNRMTQFDVNALIQDTQRGKHPERAEMMTYIFERVPDLPTTRVRNLCYTKYHNFSREPWTKEEDEELKDAYERFPGAWKIIGPLINRHPLQTRDRWRNVLVCGDNRKKSIWTREEEDQLRGAVAASLEQVRKDKAESEDPEYKAKDDMELLNWSSVSAKMGHARSRLQCLQKWGRLKDRETEVSPDPVEDEEASKGHWRLEEAIRETHNMSPAEKLRFLHAVRNSGAAREGKIPWKIVCADVTAEKGRRMVYRFCFKDLRRRIPGYKDIEFKECLEMIIRRYEEEAPSEPEEFKFTGEQPPLKFRRHRKKMGEAYTEEELLERRKRKHVRLRPLDEADGKVSAKKKRKRNAKDDSNETADSRSKKQKRKEKPQAISEEYVVEDADEEDQVDESATTKKSSKSKSKKVAKSTEQPADGEIATPNPKKKKLRDRMRQHGESQSQDSGNESHGFAPDMSDDIGSAMQSLKKAHKISQKNKKKASELASEKNHDTPDGQINGDSERLPKEEGLRNDNTGLDADFTTDDNEDPPLTPNEFNRRRSSPSPDLDTPVKYDGRRHNKKTGSPSPTGNEDEQMDNYDAVSDTSSSDGSIPARMEPLGGYSSDEEIERPRKVSLEL